MYGKLMGMWDVSNAPTKLMVFLLCVMIEVKIVRNRLMSFIRRRLMSFISWPTIGI
jgi:hypothetical protein